MAYFSIMVVQLFMLAVYTILGVLAVKGGILNKEGLGVISRFITKLALPLLIFTNTINGTTLEQFLSSSSVLLFGVLMFLSLFLLTFLMARLLHFQGNDGQIFRACFSFGNVGFVGIPIISALFPDTGMTFIALFTVVDQLMLWTIGVTMTLPVNADGSRLTKEQRLQNLRKIINPCTIAIVLAVLLVMLKIPVPGPLNTALTKTGQMTTPMAMIFIGGSFCYTRLTDILKKPFVYLMTAIKMLVFPVIFSLLLRSLGMAPETAVSFGIIAGLPTMSSIAMLAQQHDCAPELASGLIFVTTVCSLITMPILCILIG